MPRTQRTVSRPGFVVDQQSMDVNNGRQIDWDAVPASYANAAGKKALPAGKAVAVGASGDLVPRSEVDIAANPGQTAIGLLASAAVEGATSHALSGYGVYIGGAVYEELLPDAGDAEIGTIKTELDDAGTGFAFEVYEDDRS